MTEYDKKKVSEGLSMEFQLDATPDKVWRAITIPEYREQWMATDGIANVDVVSEIPGEEVRFRISELSPPFLDSTVIFQIRPNECGGTILRILQTPEISSRKSRLQAASNDNLCMIRSAA